MKPNRIATIILITLSVLTANATDKYKIVKLSGCESIRIGGRYVSVGAIFNDNDEIDWNNDRQILYVLKIGEKSNKPQTFTRKSMQKSESILDYFLHKQAGVARGSGIISSNYRLDNSRKRIAMVVGNSNYIHLSHLPNAITDAVAVSESLLKKGFDVILELDGDAATLYQDIEKFLDKVNDYGNNCVALFYYAGHGIQVDHVDYIVPFDAKLDSPIRVKSGECFPINNITDELQQRQTQQNLIILDACRVNEVNFSDNNDFFVAPNTDYGTCILYSTRSGKPSYDGKGPISPFASAFIDETSIPGRQWAEISTSIIDEVYSRTKGVQRGNSLGTTNSSFVFFPDQNDVSPRKTNTEKKVINDLESKVSVSVKKVDKSGRNNGYEYVNLDLPSGNLWATCNIGATSPYEGGQYFAWGEISTKNSYEWSNLKYCSGPKGDSFSKYDIKSDNLTVLEQSDDVAASKWSSGWHIPTLKDWKELNECCLWAWVDKEGQTGYRITSKKNGMSIFLPAAGWFGGSKINGNGDYGFYWSSSLHTEKSHYAFSCAFGKDGFNCTGKSNRFDGHCIRPVCSLK